MPNDNYILRVRGIDEQGLEGLNGEHQFTLFASSSSFDQLNDALLMNIKDDLVRHYRWLRQYGLNDSHSGNASVRDNETVWITPSGCCADTLSSGEVVECLIDGEIGKDASLDVALHLAVYRNPKTMALLHSHGPYSVAMTMDCKEFVPADFEGQLYFSRVPVVTIRMNAMSMIHRSWFRSPSRVSHRRSPRTWRIRLRGKSRSGV
ncbi:MAG: class II aldolase/adducin family protein [Candidatus Competibacteraceae bacterium]